MRPFLRKGRGEKKRVGPMAVPSYFTNSGNNQWQQMNTPGMNPYWMNLGTGQITNVSPVQQTSYSTLANMYQSGTLNPSTIFTRQTPAGLHIPTKLKHSKRVDPIIAYKRAQITFTNGKYMLYGVGSNAAYLPEDKAMCLKARNWDDDPLVDEHQSPMEGCTCGFYAMDKADLGRIGADYRHACADLEVELYGKIIKHEHGYRAEYQRVLGVYIDPVCKICHRQGNVLSFKHGDMLAPLCLMCAKNGSFGITEVANSLGIEVRWGSILT